MLFIIFMLTRFGGGNGNMIEVGGESVDAEAFAYMVVFGYFFIVLVQLVGIILGEDMNVQVGVCTDARTYVLYFRCQANHLCAGERTVYTMVKTALLSEFTLHSHGVHIFPGPGLCPGQQDSDHRQVCRRH